LRKAKVPLYLSLAKDRLGAQVSSVEKYHTPYVIVIGKKEAEEMTVKGRDLVTGLPREAIITDIDIREAMYGPLSQLVEAIKEVLETTPMDQPSVASQECRWALSRSHSRE
jgi:actin-like ATPase involved in cell morphogenesis